MSPQTNRNMNFRLMLRKTIAALIISVITTTAIAQEISNEVQTRTELELAIKATKKLKLTISPQLRFDENFSLAKYHFEGGAQYKVHKLLSVGGKYRFIVNPRETKDTEYFNRYSFNATVKKDFDRFKPSFRLRYSNFADDEMSDENFLRYKTSLKYDISKSKITPYIAAEAFQQLSANNLYKMRYSAGADYKLFKNNFLGLNYKLDYYTQEYRNRHIVSVGYKLKF